MLKDEDNHWEECSCGEKQNIVAHSFDIPNKDDNEHWKECSCGARENSTPHAFTVEGFDGKTHYKACSCGQIQEGTVEAHNFDENGDCTGCKATQGTKGLEYTLSSDESYYICSGIGTATETDIVIANVYEGLPVTTIGVSAFSGCSKLTSVTIPDGITMIKGILTWFESGAFSGCSGLTSVTLPESVTTIGKYAFYECSNLTSVTIPDSVTTIGSSAFSGCDKLIQIENSVSYVDKWVIDCDEAVTEVELRADTKGIADFAFSKCSTLTSITVDENNQKYQSIDGNLYTKDGKTLIQYAIGKVATEFIIPDSVTTIGIGAFYNCSNLTSVTIPDSVTKISICAFLGCSNLTSVTIPDSVTTIGSEAFFCCSKLTSVTIGKGVTTIGGSAFYGCSSLTSVTIPDSVTTIGEGAFQSCYKLTSVTLSGSVATIGNNAFFGCSSLTSVYITDIAKWCAIDFGSNYSNPLVHTKNLYVNNELVTELVIPDGVTTIGDMAFYNCSNLTSVTIPDGVTTIGDYAFYNCSKLTSVTIGNGVTTIGESAFFECSNLTSVTIGNGVTEIGEWAFEYCYKLIEVVNKSALSMEVGSKDNGYVAYYAKQVVTDKKDSNLIYEGDYIFYNDNETYYLVTYTGTQTELTLPESCKGNPYYIYQTAFYNWSSLTSVMIPDSVTTIGSGAFFECSNLTSVYYKGTASEWKEVSIIGSSNTPLTSATVYYYSESAPTATGNYWHYSTDGKTPVIWS